MKKFIFAGFIFVAFLLFALISGNVYMNIFIVFVGFVAALYVYHLFEQIE